MIKYYTNNITKAPYKLENGLLFIYRSPESYYYALNGTNWEPSTHTREVLSPPNVYFTEISEEEMTLLLLDCSP